MLSGVDWDSLVVEEDPDAGRIWRPRRIMEITGKGRNGWEHNVRSVC